MIKKIIFAIFLFFPILAGAINPNDVVINEVAWMGTENSANDEWIELKNNTASEINLDGWLFKTTDGKIKAYLTGKISPNGYYLLERTDDGTLPDISADFIYKGALSNTGQSLELLYHQGTIDSAGFSSQWPAGDNSTKQTMERTADLQWQTGKNPGGTPKAENSIIQPANEAAQNPPAQIVKEEAAGATKNYPSGIFINEIMPSPEGTDEENEWIEIFNENDFEVLLANWKIKDLVGKSTEYIFESGFKIKPKEYLVLKRPETKIILNNDRDELNLISPDGKVLHSVYYENSQNNYSYAKMGSIWRWTPIATPGLLNKFPASQKTEGARLPANQKTDNKNMGTSAISQSIGNNFGLLDNFENSKSQNPWFLFLTALSIVIIYGTVVLVIKLKVFGK
ncbi:MAG: lamin tail domain-containing protein [Patescibacteria group bacterium]